MGWPYYSGNSAELSSGHCSIPRLMGWNGSDLGGCPQWVWSPMVWLVLTEEEADTHTWMDRRGILESHCRILNLPPLTSTSPAATLRRERHPFDTPLGDTTPLDKTIWPQRKTLDRCPGGRNSLADRQRRGHRQLSGPRPETYERVVPLPSWMGRDTEHRRHTDDVARKKEET